MWSNVLLSINSDSLVTTCLRSSAVPPDIIDQESSGDLTVREGQDVTLACRAKGHPAPSITWRREDNQDIILDSTQTGQGHESSTKKKNERLTVVKKRPTSKTDSHTRNTQEQSLRNRCPVSLFLSASPVPFISLQEFLLLLNIWLRATLIITLQLLPITRLITSFSRSLVSFTLGQRRI